MQMKRRYKNKINTCIQCDQKFHPLYDRPTSKFCSTQCYLTNRWGEKQPPPSCLVCGDPCISSGGRNQKYCSKTCFDQAMKGRPKPSLRRRKTVPCEWCGDDVIRPVSNFHSNRTFCNRNCMGEWQSEFNIREHHPRWKGGVPYTYGSSWKHARLKALDKTNGMCGRCKKDKAILVHHLLPVRYFKKVEDAHFPSNLLPVCQKCHALEHRELATAMPLLDLLHIQNTKKRKSRKK